MKNTFTQRGMRFFRMAAVGCLALAVTGGLFAQEFKFDGYVNSGLGIVSSDAKVPDGEGTKNAATRVYAFGVNSEQPGYRFRLNGSYTNKDGNAGAKFRFQAQSKFNLGAFSLPYAYGWFSFLDGIFTVNGGLVDNSTWASAGFLGDDMGEGLGTLLKISPMEGLDLGMGAYVISQQGGGDNNILKIPQGLAVEDPAKDFSKLNIELKRLKYTFNAGYTAPDILRATITFRTKNQTGDETSLFADSESEVFGGRDESSRMIVGLGLLAVKNLTAVVEAEINTLEDYGEKGTLTFYEAVGYKLGDFGFGLNAAEYISQVEDSDLGLHLNPWLNYAIGSVVPRLDLNYFLADSKNAVGAKYHRKVFSYKSNGKDTDDLSVFAIRPSVTFNIDSKTFVEIGDLIAIENGPEGAFADAADPKKSSQLTNVFYIDFKWSF